MLAVVLACFAAGLLAQRVVPRTTELIPVLDFSVAKVTLPALILARLPDVELGADLVVPVASAWGCIALAVALVLAGSRHYGWSRATTGALLMVTPLGNTTFLGLPLVDALLGPDALDRALAFDQLGTFLALATYGAFVAAHWGTGEMGWAVLGRLVRFPPFIAVILSFPLRSLEMQSDLDDALGSLGRLVGPLAMLALGLRFRIAIEGHGRTAAVWCLVTKMVVLPLVVLGAAVIAGGLDDPMWRASVLESGMPPMVTAGVVAAHAGMDEGVATTVVGIGLALTVITVPLLRLALG